MSKLSRRLEKNCKKNLYAGYIRDTGEFYEKDYGYLLKLSEQFAVLQVENDFQLTGRKVVRRQDITSIVRGKRERHRQRIFQWEGIEQGISPYSESKLENWQSVFRAMKDSSLCIGVETYSWNGETLTIGPVRKIGKRRVAIQHITARGYLEKELTRIPYSDIRAILFNDFYIDCYKRHVRAYSGKRILNRKWQRT